MKTREKTQTEPNYHDLNITNLMHNYAFSSIVSLFKGFTFVIAYLSTVDVGPGMAATLNMIFYPHFYFAR